ncbi:MAG: hypothetical protein EKK57_00940 [Proteobacteria bacterium]|nr:MAG: hypothetical protein EKK57_00940 [Pseudomonadota bacterium]
MRITIKYHSTWRNSFLDGTDELPINKRDNSRKFKPTGNKDNNIDERQITLNTIFGVLCRLIGDQRKLYQARQEVFDDYYFKGLEDKISYEDQSIIFHETAYIINKSDDRPSQGTFLGVLPDNTPLFFSPYSQNIWHILELDPNELLEFIISESIPVVSLGNASPKTILNRLDLITSLKTYTLIKVKSSKLSELIKVKEDKYAEKKQSGKKITDNETFQLNQLKVELEQLSYDENIKFENKLLAAINVLKSRFPDRDYFDKKGEKNGEMKWIDLYSGTLYLAINLLKESGVDIEPFLNPKKNIQGFNPSGFNGVRDFLNPLSGGSKRIGGTPTVITKASGELKIFIDISEERAKDLEQKILDAGVSSFYLGKKGLAYVTKIDTRENS